MNKLSLAVVVALVGAGLTACTSRPAPVISAAPPSPVFTAPHDTSGIVDGHCSPTEPSPPAPQTSPTRSPSAADPPSRATQLVPIVAREMVLCSYNGMNTSPYRGLHTSKVITDAALVERWRTRLNWLQPLVPVLTSCPMGQGDLLRIAFVASPQSSVVLTGTLSGCAFLTNGSQARRLYNPADLTIQADLTRLAGG